MWFWRSKGADPIMICKLDVASISFFVVWSNGRRLVKDMACCGMERKAILTAPFSVCQREAR